MFTCWPMVDIGKASEKAGWVSACLCMHLCMCDTQFSQTCCRRTLIAHILFLAHLKGDRSDESHVFFAIFGWFKRKPVKISNFFIINRNNCYGLLLGNWVCAFQWHQYEPPTSPSFGVDSVKKRKKSDVPLSCDKSVLWSFSDQQFPAANLFLHMFEDNSSHKFWRLCILLRLHCNPLIDAYALSQAVACIAKAAIDFHAWRPIGKG